MGLVGTLGSNIILLNLIILIDNLIKYQDTFEMLIMWMYNSLVSKSTYKILTFLWKELFKNSKEDPTLFRKNVKNTVNFILKCL